MTRMTDYVEVDKASLENKTEFDTGRCLFCKEREEFPKEDQIITLSIHLVCLLLIAYNLPGKSGKILLKALQKVRPHE